MSEKDKDIDTSNMSMDEIAELQKQNCIFCKIAEKEIPAKIIHEDKDIICILDINPASEGHILVFPKKHYMILPHIPENITQSMFRNVKLMSNTLLKTLQCRGTSIFVANGAAAGQKAPHVLVHVFPRRDGDGLLQLPKYEMNLEQSEKLIKTLNPYFNKIFGKEVKEDDKLEELEVKSEINLDDSNKKIIREVSEKDNSNNNNNISIEDNDKVIQSNENKKSISDKKNNTKRKSIKRKTSTVNSVNSDTNSGQSINQKPVNLDDISKLFGVR